MAATLGARFIVFWQQEWLPVPMSQLPAIFLQQAISASVVAAVGTQASTGAANHRKAKSKEMERRMVTIESYNFYDSR